MKKRKIIIYMAGLVIFLGAKTTLAEVGDFRAGNISIGHSIQSTQVTLPIAKTLVAQDVSSTTAQLAGMVNPNNGATKYWFQYGKTQNLKQSTGFIYAGKSGEFINVFINIKNLDPNTTYYYRIVAENNVDATNGEIATFKTLNN